tara:strand:- start:150 stop:356 length:207 start_codon:yes stop_codon:yes gene_type:complete
MPLNSDHTASISESIGLCRANAFAASTWMGEAVRVYINEEKRYYFRLSGDPRPEPNDIVVWPQPKVAA